MLTPEKIRNHHHQLSNDETIARLRGLIDLNDARIDELLLEGSVVSGRLSRIEAADVFRVVSRDDLVAKCTCGLSWGSKDAAATKSLVAAFEQSGYGSTWLVKCDRFPVSGQPCPHCNVLLQRQHLTFTAKADSKPWWRFWRKDG